jgi:hypothetical protein
VNTKLAGADRLLSYFGRVEQDKLLAHLPALQVYCRRRFFSSSDQLLVPVLQHLEFQPLRHG